jgi:hypothetical protein
VVVASVPFCRVVFRQPSPRPGDDLIPALLRVYTRINIDDGDDPKVQK